MWTAWLSLCVAIVMAGETYTSFSFSRKINTCDPNDRPIESTTSKIVWAYSDEDPKNGVAPKHTNKGLGSVRFYSQGNTLPPLPDDAEHLDITAGGNTEIEFNIPGQRPTSNYWCVVQKLGRSMFTTKKHLIRVEPIIDPRYRSQVHHLIVYGCQTPLPEQDSNFAGTCFDGNMPESVRNCANGPLVAAWAVGGDVFDFPSNVGMPFQSADDLHFVIQLHYENPSNVTMFDNSGLRLWFTSHLREHEAGVSMYGHVNTPQFIIPPNRESYKYEAWMTPECTSQLPAEGINIVAMGLHTHTIGHAIRVQHYRNGSELAPILEEPYYDFNYQDYTRLDTLGREPVKVLPGDYMRVECSYNSLGRDVDTPFGLSTSEEMCLAYFLYYPISLPFIAYGDFTSSVPEMGKTAFCGNSSYNNVTIPTFEPYVPPPCPYVPPDPSRVTPTLRNGTGRDGLVNAAMYDRSVYLDEENKVKLFWSVDKINLLLHAAIEVQTDGWVGFGVSSFGMVGADVAMGWVDEDGGIHFNDRFAVVQAEPIIDTHQDYFDVTGAQISLSSSSSSSSSSRSTAIALGILIPSLLALFILSLYYCIRKKRGGKREFNELERDIEQEAEMAERVNEGDRVTNELVLEA